jgi:ribose transport system substrate-binding protein
MKRIASSLASLFLILAFASCGNKKQSGDSGSAKPNSTKKLKLAFVSNTAANFWTIARRGCDAAEKELGNVKVEFHLPSTGGAAEQQQILDDLLAAGVDGIAVSPVDPENQTAALNKIAEQTLLITVDSDAPKSKRVCYIGTDNFAAGQQAGKLIREALPNGGKIMVFVGKMDAQNAQERFGGIKKELEGSSVQIIDVRTDDTDTVRAQKNVEDTLVKYPDVACLVGLWSYNGPAILNAVKSGGKIGQVKIVCFDEEDETLGGVADGAIYGTIVQQPYEFGQQAIVRMAKHVGGDQASLDGGKQIVPTLSIKKENVSDFRAKLKAMLGK